MVYSCTTENYLFMWYLLAVSFKITCRTILLQLTTQASFIHKNLLHSTKENGWKLIRFQLVTCASAIFCSFCEIEEVFAVKWSRLPENLSDERETFDILSAAGHYWQRYILISYKTLTNLSTSFITIRYYVQRTYEAVSLVKY